MPRGTVVNIILRVWLGQSSLSSFSSPRVSSSQIGEKNQRKCSSLRHLFVYVSLQSYPTLCSPVGCSLPGSSVHGILQARILERVALRPSRGVFHTQRLNPCLFCLLYCQVGSLPPAPPETPLLVYKAKENTL